MPPREIALGHRVIDSEARLGFPPFPPLLRQRRRLDYRQGQGIEQALLRLAPAPSIRHCPAARPRRASGMTKNIRNRSKFDASKCRFAPGPLGRHAMNSEANSGFPFLPPCHRFGHAGGYGKDRGKGCTDCFKQSPARGLARGRGFSPCTARCGRRFAGRARWSARRC